MQAFTDLQFNSNWVSGVPGAPPRVVPAQVGQVAPILEPGFSTYFMTQQGPRQQSVYATPAVIPTAAVGANPWDHIFGTYAQWPNAPSPAILPPPAPQTSFA